MGHLYPDNLSKILWIRSQIDGVVTIERAIQEARDSDEKVCCAEGCYDDQYMYEMAFYDLLYFYNAWGWIEFVPENGAQEKALALWRGDELEDAWEPDHKNHWAEREIFRVPFKFVQEMEIEYEDEKGIRWLRSCHLRYIES